MKRMYKNEQKGKGSMKNFFKRLFCRHNYIFVDQYIDGGIQKVIVYECTKCGKRKGVCI